MPIAHPSLDLTTQTQALHAPGTDSPRKAFRLYRIVLCLQRLPFVPHQSEPDMPTVVSTYVDGVDLADTIATAINASVKQAVAEVLTAKASEADLTLGTRAQILGKSPPLSHPILLVLTKLQRMPRSCGPSSPTASRSPKSAAQARYQQCS